MRSEEEKRSRILENSFKLFSTFGFTRVSVDEIARSAGVGKATIYQLYPSKQELILGTIDFMTSSIEKKLELLPSDKTLSEPEKLSAYFKVISDMLKHIRPEVLRELEKECPEAYNLIRSRRKDIILSKFLEFIREGKRKGFIDIFADEKVVSHILIGTMDYFQRSAC